MQLKILYFAKFRDIAGYSQQDISAPPSLLTVQDLINFLLERDSALSAIFGQETINSQLRIAIDQEFADLDSPVHDGQEIAFFPPVTGG